MYIWLNSKVWGIRVAHMENDDEYQSRRLKGNIYIFYILIFELFSTNSSSGNYDAAFDDILHSILFISCLCMHNRIRDLLHKLHFRSSTDGKLSDLSNCRQYCFLKCPDMLGSFVWQYHASFLKTCLLIHTDKTLAKKSTYWTVTYSNIIRLINDSLMMQIIALLSTEL